MPVHHDEDLPPALAILIAGMVAPALVAAVARDVLEMYVSAGQFVVLAAVVYAFVAWALLERLDLDRTTFLLVSIVWPWPVLFAILFVVLLLNQGEQVMTGPLADVFSYLTGNSVGSFFGYGFLFALAGIGAVALSKQVEALAERDGRVPEARVVLAAIGLAALVLSLAVIGVNQANASTATVSAVEPGFDEYRPVLEVTVEGRPAELRVTAVPPDGTPVTQRLSRASMQGGTGTARFEIGLASWHSLPLQRGTYRVTVTSLAGVPVDTAEFHVERSPRATIETVIVNPESLDRDRLPDRTVNLSPAHEPRLGVVVENPSVFHTRVSAEIRAGDSYAKSTDIHLPPAERGGVVISIPDETVQAIHEEHGGVVTLELAQDGETVVTESVQLPRD